MNLKKKLNEMQKNLPHFISGMISLKRAVSLNKKPHPIMGWGLKIIRVVKIKFYIS
jgi:hypothetical protein